MKSSTTTPPDKVRAVSTESVSRRRADAFTSSRSTTTSMSCFSYFFSVGRSPAAPPPALSSRITTPSTRAREYPLACRSRSISVYSPLRPRTTGASTWNLAPSSSSSTLSTICCGLCLAIGRPQIGQCGLPTRA